MTFNEVPTKAQLSLLAMAVMACAEIMCRGQETAAQKQAVDLLCARFGLTLEDLVQLTVLPPEIDQYVQKVMDEGAKRPVSDFEGKAKPAPEYSQDDLDLIRVEYEPIDTSVLRQGAVNDGVITVQQAATFERDQILTAILERRLRSEA